MTSTSRETLRRNLPRPLVWTLRLFAAFLALIAVLAASGAAFEALASNSDATRLAPPGRLVDVGGFRLHLNCTGEGLPTIILDAGLGEASLDWALVQPDLARTTRVCAYDRAGMGWSDSSPHPRTPAIIAEELHTLLSHGNILGPYVLVAHSLSGKYARMFAIRHPSEVAGVVLVDARHEYLDEIASTEEVRGFYEAVDAQGRQYGLARRFGIVRLFGASLAGGPAFPAATRSAMALVATQPNAIAATSAEGRGRAANDEDLHATTLGDRPLIVLVAGQSLASTPHWEEAQERQAALSSHSETRVARGSSHCIQCDDPQLVVTAVNDVVASVRAER